MKWMIFIVLSGLMLSDDTYTVDELTGKGGLTFSGDGFQLQEEARLQFDLMKQAAKKEGINLYVVSSYRSFDHQNRIWGNKYDKFTKQGLSPQKAIDKIIEYSTIPGTSRHHWGTDLDIIDNTKGVPSNPLSESHFKEGGRFHQMKKWMDKNANEYGFHLVYTDATDRKGFKYEPWHYTYKPLSLPMLKAYLEIDLKDFLKKNKVKGSDYFSDEFIEKYKKENILDINPDLIPQDSVATK